MNSDSPIANWRMASASLVKPSTTSPDIVSEALICLKSEEEKGLGDRGWPGSGSATPDRVSGVGVGGRAGCPG